MTSERFQQCLTVLRWSQFDIAVVLKCDVFLVHAWSNGTAPVPDDIAAWLEKLAKAHQRARVPASYEGRQFEMRVGRNIRIGQ